MLFVRTVCVILCDRIPVFEASVYSYSIVYRVWFFLPGVNPLKNFDIR